MEEKKWKKRLIAFKDTIFPLKVIGDDGPENTSSVPSKIQTTKQIYCSS